MPKVAGHLRRLRDGRQASVSPHRRRDATATPQPDLFRTDSGVKRALPLGQPSVVTAGNTGSTGAQAPRNEAES